MVETSDDPSLSDRIRSNAHVWKSTLFGTDRRGSIIPLAHQPTCNSDAGTTPTRSATDSGQSNLSYTAGDHVAHEILPVTPPPSAPPPLEDGHREAPSAIEPEVKPNFAIRFYHTAKEILLSSIINVLLVFVPIGIALNFTPVSPTIVFAINAIAIIPLAGLLSHATESVAASMGDTVGALLNVTFGNAVELIIFMYVKLRNQDNREPEVVISTFNSIASHIIFSVAPHVPLCIALVKNEIRIVQASLLGSILANLLLILGMCFLFGGLRYREQIYNSTVTQMSACLLSLSVMSLLLPTAFHASFTDSVRADLAVLQVSRGSSIILLILYILYLLFQLKSHAYMYESTPQHVIDEESHPGVLADMLGSSSSSDSSDSSNDTDSDASTGSNTTAKRIRRAFRGRRRRKSSASSKEAPSLPSAIRTPSDGTFSESVFFRSPTDTVARSSLDAIASGDEADTDGKNDNRGIRFRTPMIARDFENEKISSDAPKPHETRSKRKPRRHRKHSKQSEKQVEMSEKASPLEGPAPNQPSLSPRVSFVEGVQIAPDPLARRSFNIRGISVLPTIPKMLTSTVFSAANPTGPLTSGGNVPVTVPRAPYGLRRASSLPDRLNKTHSVPQVQPQLQLIPTNQSAVSLISNESRDGKKYISRTSAIILLLISTALVAVCAEFLVSSINYLVDHTSVSQAFIGLIILPIVGNAAEHVTAVTVASKNKMDLAIGVAVGSSIQIALFVTPVIVLLGWILGANMSLYFSLFETVSLFVSAFIVNFLVLDGRSNYLEGALLIAAYVIIAVAAFFYPDQSQQSIVGGA